MLEWMHDPDVVKYMSTDFSSKTLEDCCAFIKSSSSDKENLHFAIVDENDEYQGTVSLKHIHNKKAEFAIAIRKSAMGKGFSRLAMREIIKYGFSKLQLDCIYWCVNPNNIRAVRFYDRNGYRRNAALHHILQQDENQIKGFEWYSVQAQSVTI